MSGTYWRDPGAGCQFLGRCRLVDKDWVVGEGSIAERRLVGFGMKLGCAVKRVGLSRFVDKACDGVRLACQLGAALGCGWLVGR
jgi:hypothetical protein